MKKCAALLAVLALMGSFAGAAFAQDTAMEKAAEEPQAGGYTVGGTVTFGSYEQDNDPANGAEPIEWLVLAVDGDRALLLSAYGLDAQKYNDYTKKITWCRCSLRFWLNYTFFKEAFTPAERERVLTTTLENGQTPGYDSYGCDDTEDQVFLLSYAEALQFLPADADRITQPTAYAIARGAYAEADTGYGWWWLRSPGTDNANACGVRTDGRISGYGGREVSRGSGSVRPAIWVTIGE